MGYNHNDPSLRTGEGGVTIWTLQEMLQKKKYDALNHLFDNGVTMNSLPVGMSAGAGGAAFNKTLLFAWAVPDADPLRHGYWPMTHIGIDVSNGLVSWFALTLWRGKIFFPSNNKRISEGLNRMRKLPFAPFSPFVPMAKF